MLTPVRLSRISLYIFIGCLALFAIATVIMAQSPASDTVLGPNAEAIGSIIAVLLAIIATLIGLTWRALMFRLDRLESQHTTLCRVLLASTMALHPNSSQEVREMLRDLRL
jgi:hypothetical protein